MRVPRILIPMLLVCTSLFATATNPVSPATPAAGSGAEQLRQVGMVIVPGAPGFSGAAFANGMLLLVHPGASAVDVFDPERRRVVAEVVGLQSPRALAVDKKAGRVYIADHGNNSIVVVAFEGWKVIDSIALPGSPDALQLTGDGKLYWADADAETISLLDLHTKQDVARVELGGRPRGLAWDAQRQIVFAALQDAHRIVAITLSPAGENGATNAPQLKVVNRFTLNASQPTSLIYDPQYHELYTSVRFAVLAVNADTGAEIDRVAAPAGVDSLWLDPDSRTLYAASEGSLLVMQAKGSLSKVNEIATAGIKGDTVAFDAEKNIVLVPGGGQGQSKLLILRPTSANGQPAANDTDARVR